MVNEVDQKRTGLTRVDNLFGKEGFGGAERVLHRLEFLVEAVPEIEKIAFPMTPDDIPGKGSYEVALRVAEKLGVEIVPYLIDEERDSVSTARAIKKEDVDGIVISSDTSVWSQLATYIDQAKQEKLPFAVFDLNMVKQGGLLGYGPDYFGSGEQSAVYADKVLRGANPATLPIDSPRKLLLVVNTATAKAIGFEFSQEFLRKADEVITE